MARALALSLMVLAAASGCGKKDGPTDTTGVDPTQAVAAAEQASAMQTTAASEALLDDVSDPLSSAAGDITSLGGYDDGGLGGYDDFGFVISKPIRELDPAAKIGEGARRALAEVAEKSAAVASTQSCSTAAQPDGGSLTVCITQTDTADVYLVTISRTSPTGPVRSVSQRFYVDNNGTPAQRGDDRILSYESMVTLAGNTTIELRMLPESGEYIVDGALVDLFQRIRPATGMLLEESSNIRLNVGDVETDGDEVFYSMFSQVQYRNGASATLDVSDLSQDGISDGDSVEAVSQFTAAPSNPRLQTTSSTVVLMIGQLEDESDDRVVRLARRTVFDGQTISGGSPTSETEFIPSQPVQDGEEPCGGRFTQEASFPASWETATSSLLIQRTCGVGGSATLELTFSDGTSSQRTITWDAAGVATLDATQRDGTTVHGTLQPGNFEIDTTYPPGNDPVSSHQEGTWGGGTRTYTRVTTYQNANQDTLYVQGQATSDSTRSVTGYTTTSAGRVDFEMTVNTVAGTVVGSAWGPDDETLVFSITPLEEEEGWLLEFTYEDPSARLTVVGSVEIGGDHSGCGTLTVTVGPKTDEYPFCLDLDGDGTIDGTVPF